jgi:hypothetical protein
MALRSIFDHISKASLTCRKIHHLRPGLNPRTVFIGKHAKHYTTEDDYNLGLMSRRVRTSISIRCDVLQLFVVASVILKHSRCTNKETEQEVLGRTDRPTFPT